MSERRSFRCSWRSTLVARLSTLTLFRSAKNMAFKGGAEQREERRKEKNRFRALSLSLPLPLPLSLSLFDRKENTFISQTLKRRLFSLTLLPKFALPFSPVTLPSVSLRRFPSIPHRRQNPTLSSTTALSRLGHCHQQSHSGGAGDGASPLAG